MATPPNATDAVTAPARASWRLLRRTPLVLWDMNTLLLGWWPGRERGSQGRADRAKYGERDVV
jgi:hypothetical protein